MRRPVPRIAVAVLPVVGPTYYRSNSGKSGRARMRKEKDAELPERALLGRLRGLIRCRGSLWAESLFDPCVKVCRFVHREPTRLSKRWAPTDDRELRKRSRTDGNSPHPADVVRSLLAP
jgi:hypothetical protein